MSLRPLVLAVCLLLAAAALPAIAGAQAGVPNRGPAPDRAALVGPLCRSDTPNFRLWWTGRPNAPGAVEGARGCAQLPPPVQEVRRVAESTRRRAVQMGFPAMVGDARPPVLRDPRFTRQILGAPASARASALGTLNPAVRGRYLAGLSAAQRNRLVSGLPPALQRRLAGELRVAARGRPSDFIGGDRRVDIVIDGAGATGMVQRGQPGIAVCRTTGGARNRRFVGAWVVVLAQPGESLASTTVHELMHVLQCNMGIGQNAPLLVKEGTAEWFAAVVDPVSFPGVPDPDAGRIRGGDARALAFCNNFDPLAGELDAYASWAVWEALDAGSPRATLVRTVLNRYRRAPAEGPAAAIRSVGDTRWSQGLRAAVRTVCGAGRSPSGVVNFSPALRRFLGAGAGNSAAQPGTPATNVVPRAGALTFAARWGAGTGATLRLSSPVLGPEQLAASLVVTTSAGPLTPMVRQGAVFVDIPPEAAAEGFVPVTIANPSTRAALPVIAGVFPAIT